MKGSAPATFSKKNADAPAACEALAVVQVVCIKSYPTQAGEIQLKGHLSKCIAGSSSSIPVLKETQLSW
jgi:hypothetical protein